MNLIIKNIISNKMLIENDLAALFHDMKVKSYNLSDEDKFIILIERPYYEEYRETSMLALFPALRMPYIDTIVEFSLIDSVEKKESDATNTDWFLSFDIDVENKKVMVSGVLNKYEINISNKSKIKIYDIGNKKIRMCLELGKNIKKMADNINNLKNQVVM